MMNVEDFRIMFRAHLSLEIWDKWRKGQLDVSMRRNTPDGCEYEELPKEAADQILDGGNPFLRGSGRPHRGDFRPLRLLPVWHHHVQTQRVCDRRRLPE